MCKKNFANVYRLQRHMISHDESAVLRRFKCADCGKAFKFKHHLKVLLYYTTLCLIRSPVTMNCYLHCIVDRVGAINDSK